VEEEGTSGFSATPNLGMGMEKGVDSKDEKTKNRSVRLLLLYHLHIRRRKKKKKKRRESWSISPIFAPQPKGVKIGGEKRKEEKAASDRPSRVRLEPEKKKKRKEGRGKSAIGLSHTGTDKRAAEKEQSAVTNFPCSP